MDKLRQIQLCELEMLKEVHRVCENNNVQYSIAYGTLLGAVRHKGFIPWDDDLDIYIKLDDIPKIENIFSKNYFFQSPKSDPRMSYIYYKLRKNGTYMEEDCNKNNEIHHGIWIDIFPYVDASKSESGKKAQFTFSNILQMFRYKYHYTKLKKMSKYRFFAKLMVAIENICLFTIKILGSKNSSEYFVFAQDPYKIRFYKKQYFDNLIKYQFEDECFWGIRDNNEYLTERYGSDYMTPKKYAHFNNYDDVVI